MPWFSWSNANINNITGYWSGRKGYFITPGSEPAAGAFTWKAGYPDALPPQHVWVLESFYGYAQYSVNSCTPYDPGRNGAAFQGTVNACGPATFGTHAVIKRRWRLYACSRDGTAVVDVTNNAVTGNPGVANGFPAPANNTVTVAVDNLLDFHATLSESHTAPLISVTHSGAFEDAPEFEELTNLPAGEWTVCYSPTGAWDQGRNFSAEGNPHCITYNYSVQHPEWIYSHQEYTPPCTASPLP